MNNEYFLSVKMEKYYFPDIHKEKRKYKNDKDNLQDICNIIEEMELDFKKDKINNKNIINKKKNNAINMLDSEKEILQYKKNRLNMLNLELITTKKDNIIRKIELEDKKTSLIELLS